MRCENLGVWKRSCRLSVEIYKYFKQNKDFGKNYQNIIKVTNDTK